jgi:cytochrome c-type biogenesis protein CcmE
VVVEGTVARDGIFESHRLMVSHGNEYRAPNDPAAINLKKLMDSTDGLDASDKK